MTLPPTGDWPTEADGLASIAADPEETPERRKRALEDLLPTIRRVARRVAARFAGQYREEVQDEAEGEVWQAMSGFQRGASFAAWCYAVLRNGPVDRLRKAQHERAHREGLTATREDADLQLALERALDRQEVFLESDLAELRKWPLSQRLALLSLSGLWLKVPQAEWQ